MRVNIIQISMSDLISSSSFEPLPCVTKIQRWARQIIFKRRLEKFLQRACSLLHRIRLIQRWWKKIHSARDKSFHYPLLRTSRGEFINAALSPVMKPTSSTGHTKTGQQRTALIKKQNNPITLQRFPYPFHNRITTSSFRESLCNKKSIPEKKKSLLRAVVRGYAVRRLKRSDEFVWRLQKVYDVIDEISRSDETGWSEWLLSELKRAKVRCCDWLAKAEQPGWFKIARR